MRLSFKVLTGLLTLLAFLFMTGAASAASMGVRDNAHFFSSDAIGEAENAIQQIYQAHQRDLLIETLPSIPSDQQEEFQRLGKDAFFRQWADNRALQAGVQGVYVLITKNPPSSASGGRQFHRSVLI